MTNPFEKYIDFLINNLNLSEKAINYMEHNWNLEYRYYHNINHLSYICESIEEKFEKGIISEEDKFILLESAFFHDVIYEPWSDENEENSSLLYTEVCKAKPQVLEIIESTKYRRRPDNSYRLPSIFWEIDNSILRGDIQTLFKYEIDISKEYQFVPYDTYKEKRIEFLQSCIGLFANDVNINILIEYVKSRKLNIALYVGTFAPLHKGHLSIISKASKIFDKVIIGFGRNMNKDINYSEDVKSVIATAKENIRHKQVIEYDKLTTNLIKELSSNYNVTLVRGIRNSKDLEYEIENLRLMEDIYPEINIINIICDRNHTHISSSKIRSMIDSGYSNEAKTYLT